MSQALSPNNALQRRYPVRMPIRMTFRERAMIGKRACSLNRSISRYLVELATLDTAMLLPEEKARLKFLYALFQNATEKVQEVLASEPLAAKSSEEVNSVRLSLQEVLRLLEVIGEEVGRRVG